MRRIAYWLSILLIFMVPWEDSISVTTLGDGFGCGWILDGNHPDRRTVSETPSFSHACFVILFMELCKRVLELGHRRHTSANKNLQSDFPPDAYILGAFSKA